MKLETLFGRCAWRGRIREPLVVANMFREIFRVIPVLRFDINIGKVLELAAEQTYHSMMHYTST